VDPGNALDSLDRAIDAASRYGLDVTDARAVRTTLAERSGFPGDLYVLALAGGTGVGKSSLLNALAGTAVSAVGARRPTTAVPVAWLPAHRLAEAAPLLEWLGDVEVRVHDSGGDALAVLDLPDLDSIERGHATRVDALLPKVDAVVWVSDLEKYQDAVLHDVYLRSWMRRLSRQAIVLNKVDRVPPSDAEPLRADLRRQLAREGLPAAPVLLTSATSDVSELRRWLADGVEAKRVVIERRRASANAVLADLATAGGVSSEQEPSPLITPERREAAAGAATREMLSVLDLAGLERQSVAATRRAARLRGGGPIGIVRSFAERGLGVGGGRADPEGFLRRWRERGSMVRASQVIRDLVADAMPQVPASARRNLAGLADTSTITERLGRAADRAAGGSAGAFVPPASRMWPIVGIVQLAATLAALLGLVWLVTLWLGGGRPEPSAVSVPILGPIPIPTLLVVVGVLGWLLLGRLLAAHAAWLGRRWAGRTVADLSREVRRVVDETALGDLAEYERARSDLWRATHPRS
jgi:energy-coupling factor transporter ATP-binding protein EcfA2